MNNKNITIDANIEGWDLTKATRLITIVANNGDLLGIDIPGLYIGLNENSGNIYAFNESSDNNIIPYIDINGGLHFYLSLPYYEWEEDINGYKTLDDVIHDYLVCVHNIESIDEVEDDDIMEDVEYIKARIDNDILAKINNIMQEYENKYGEE